MGASPFLDDYHFQDTAFFIPFKAKRVDMTACFACYALPMYLLPLAAL